MVQVQQIFFSLWNFYFFLFTQKQENSRSNGTKFKFCKGCLPQLLLGSFLNTLSQITIKTNKYQLCSILDVNYLGVTHGTLFSRDVYVNNFWKKQFRLMITCPNYVPMFHKIIIFYLGFFGFSYLQYVAPSHGIYVKQ